MKYTYEYIPLRGLSDVQNQEHPEDLDAWYLYVCWPVAETKAHALEHPFAQECNTWKPCHAYDKTDMRFLHHKVPKRGSLDSSLELECFCGE
jgi:hypothetical protein